MRSDLLQSLAVAAALAAACSGSTPPAGPAPANLSMAPSVGFSGDPVPVVISGNGFLAKATQPQGGGEPVLDTRHRAWLGSTELTGVTWLGTTTLNATVPPGLAPGTYDLTVENALGNQGTAKGAYTALAAPPFSATATFDHATVDVGQTLTLTVTVTNGGSSAIDGFRLGVPTVSSSDGGSARPSSDQPLAPSAIAAGEKLTFTWTYAPTLPGHISITVEVRGLESVSGHAVTAALAAPAEALIQLPAALTATWIGQPSTQTVDSPVSLTLELANAAGAATAEVTAVTPSTSPATNVTCTVVAPAPTATVPIQIAGGSSQRFTWSCTATAFGDYQFSAAVAANDLNTGELLSVVPAVVTVNYTTRLVLTVVPSGTGSGTVTSTPAGIAGCGSQVGTCSATFQSGTTVALAAAPATGSTLSWAGCTPAPGMPTQCTVTIDGAKTITATFTLDQEALTITAPPNGTITCGGGACASSYGYGTIVALTATPSAGYTFGGWTGGACNGTTSPCVLTMDGPKTVGATFDASPQPLTLSASPPGGTMGFACNGVACQSSYATGTALTVEAAPAAGFTFSGWGGACSGTGACTFTMPPGGATVTASFTLDQEALTITAPSNGTITCGGGACASSYGYGTIVTLSATPSAGYTFGGWTGGACNGTTSPCVLTMDGPKTVGATFDASPQPLSLSASPPDGTTGFACNGVPCQSSYATGTVLTVEAAPAAGFTFSGWGGACSGTGACTFTMPPGGATVTATFI